MSAELDRPRPVPKARMLDPVFTVLDVEPVEHALTPALRFQLHVSDPDGREVYAIALTTQIQVDPARRTYDEATRARLVELFGEPQRWGATTHSFQWAEVGVLVPGFTGATSFALELPCTYDLEVAASKYFYSLRDGLVPLSFHFTGMVLYRDAGERLRVTGVPWSCSARWSMPVEAWKTTMASTYPGGGWIRLPSHSSVVTSSSSITRPPGAPPPSRRTSDGPRAP